MRSDVFIMSTRLSGKVALITGGSSGIGRGIAKRFVSEGAKVAVIGRDERRLKELKNEMGSDFQAIQGDVTDHERLKEMFKEVKDNFGFVDTLVCSADHIGVTGVSKSPRQQSNRNCEIEIF